MTKNLSKFVLSLLLIVWALSNVAYAEESTTSGKIHGYAIPEYYYVGSHHTEGAEDEKDDKNTSLVSAFGHIKISKKASIVLRYDHFLDVNLKETTGYLPFASTIAPVRFFIVGIDIKVNKWFQFGPNIKYAFYDDPAEAGVEKPGSDFYFNLTGKIKFESKL